jgi:hypothetical protein
MLQDSSPAPSWHRECERHAVGRLELDEIRTVGLWAMDCDFVLLHSQPPASTRKLGDGRGKVGIAFHGSMLLPCCIALNNAQAAIAATVITKPKSVVVRECNMDVLLSQEVRRLMRAHPAARRLTLGVRSKNCRLRGACGSKSEPRKFGPLGKSGNKESRTTG